MTHSFLESVFPPDFQTAAAGLLEPVLAEMLAPLPHVIWEFFSHAGTSKLSLRMRLSAMMPCSCWRLILPRKPWPGTSNSPSSPAGGVGYDMIDVPACTETDVLLAITTDAVRKPVAEAILTFILALAKKLPGKG